MKKMKKILNLLNAEISALREKKKKLNEEGESLMILLMGESALSFIKKELK